MKEYKDCLACGHSCSEESENDNEDDKLFCVLHQKYIKEEDVCEDFN